MNEVGTSAGLIVGQTNRTTLSSAILATGFGLAVLVSCLAAIVATNSTHRQLKGILDPNNDPGIVRLATRVMDCLSIYDKPCRTGNQTRPDCNSSFHQWIGFGCLNTGEGIPGIETWNTPYCESIETWIDLAQKTDADDTTFANFLEDGNPKVAFLGFIALVATGSYVNRPDLASKVVNALDNVEDDGSDEMAVTIRVLAKAVGRIDLETTSLCSQVVRTFRGHKSDRVRTAMLNSDLVANNIQCLGLYDAAFETAKNAKSVALGIAAFKAMGQTIPKSSAPEICRLLLDRASAPPYGVLGSTYSDTDRDGVGFVADVAAAHYVANNAECSEQWKDLLSVFEKKTELCDHRFICVNRVNRATCAWLQVVEQIESQLRDSDPAKARASALISSAIERHCGSSYCISGDGRATYRDMLGEEYDNERQGN